MTTAARDEVRRLADGSLWSLAAELAAAPLGLALAIYLTRRLGPDSFGLYALCLAPVLTVEHALTSLFGRTTIQVVAGATDWRAAAAQQARWHIGLGLVAGLVGLALASPIAALLDEPRAATLLRLLAIDIPVFAVATACRNVLTAQGRFRRRTLIGLVRSAGRLLLGLVLVELGTGIVGAVLGHLLATAAAALVGLRGGVLADWRRGAQRDGRGGGTASLLLTGTALATLLFERMDLYLLKALGTRIEVVGTYAAAQTLALAVGLISAAYSSLLLSTLNRLLAAGQQQAAQALGALTLRGFLILLPFAALVSSSSEALVTLAFGAAYVEAARPLPLLLFAALAMVAWDLSISFLTARGRAGLTLAVAVGVVLGALVAQLLVIPRAGPVGAAVVTCTAAMVGLGVSTALVCGVGGVQLPWVTLARAAMLGALGVGGALLGRGLGIPQLLSVLALGAVLAVGWWLSGELSRDELARLRSWLTTPRPAPPRAPGP